VVAAPWLSGKHGLTTSAFCLGEGDSKWQSKVSRPPRPLNKEWEDMARAVLKGKDPAEKLTWRTAEVSHV
jgi:hypothetical protein